MCKQISGAMEGRVDLLNKPISTAATSVILLELGELKLAKRLEDVLKILLSDAEVDIANIQTVKGDRVRVATSGARFANLAVLLSFGQLDNNWDT